MIETSIEQEGFKILEGKKKLVGSLVVQHIIHLGNFVGFGFFV